jgi:hypothetical protein
MLSARSADWAQVGYCDLAAMGGRNDAADLSTAIRLPPDEQVSWS